MVDWIGIITTVELFVVLLLVGAIFYAIKKGFNQIINGLESLDERVAQLQEK